MPFFAKLLKPSAVVGAAMSLTSIAVAGESLLVVPAPVPPDGYYQGTATHLGFVLVPNSDPASKGIGLQKGDTLAVLLPKEFKRQDSVAVRDDSDFNLTLTKGWPQAPVKQAGQYKIVYDAKSNAIGVRADTDIGTDGANSPGIKMIHLRGGTFLTPVAGKYNVEARLADAGGNTKQTWSGVIDIAAGPMAGRVAPTNFHLGPSENADFQETARNQDAPKMLGVLLWDGAGKPRNGVGIATADRARFPSYEHLLVAVKRGDEAPDAAAGEVIGGTVVVGAARRHGSDHRVSEWP